MTPWTRNPAIVAWPPIWSRSILERVFIITWRHELQRFKHLNWGTKKQINKIPKWANLDGHYGVTLTMPHFLNDAVSSTSQCFYWFQITCINLKSLGANCNWESISRGSLHTQNWVGWWTNSLIIQIIYHATFRPAQSRQSVSSFGGLSFDPHCIFLSTLLKPS